MDITIHHTMKKVFTRAEWKRDLQGGPYCFCILCAANTAKVLDAPKKLWYIYVHYIEAFYPRHNFLEISKFLLSKKLNLKLGSILAQNSTFNFEGV